MIQFDDYLYRGPRPNSMQELKDQGFVDSFNLERGWFEAFHQDQYEKERYNFSPKLMRLDYPMSDVLIPTIEILETITFRLHMNNRQASKTYLHCLKGKDRTGMVVAAYRILYQDWTVEKAKQEMFDLGFHKFPYFYWVPQLERLK
ncbi:MAG: hypothetical protein ACHQUC_01315 [Chlamydiales bacterium]